MAVWRQADGRGWEVEVEDLEGLPDPATLNARIESLVRRRPEQYVWNYNRYKVPAGMTPPTRNPEVNMAMGCIPPVHPESGG